MNVIAIPVQWIRLHPQVVSWEVAGRVAQVVELIPQNPAILRRLRNNLDSDW